jgi:hypothetical protein
MSNLVVNRDLAPGSAQSVPGTATISFVGDPATQSACSGATITLSHVSN